MFSVDIDHCYVIVNTISTNRTGLYTSQRCAVYGSTDRSVCTAMTVRIESILQSIMYYIQSVVLTRSGIQIWFSQCSLSQLLFVGSELKEEQRRSRNMRTWGDWAQACHRKSSSWFLIQCIDPELIKLLYPIFHHIVSYWIFTWAIGAKNYFKAMTGITFNLMGETLVFSV